MFNKLDLFSNVTPFFSRDSQSQYSDPFHIKNKLHEDELKTANKKLEIIEKKINNEPSFLQSNKKTLLLLGFMALAITALAVGIYTPYGPDGLSAFESIAGQKGGAIMFENAKLASGFISAGFGVTIAVAGITCLSLIGNLISHRNKRSQNLKSKKDIENKITNITTQRNDDLEKFAEKEDKYNSREQDLNQREQNLKHKEDNFKQRERERERSAAVPGGSPTSASATQVGGSQSRDGGGASLSSS